MSVEHILETLAKATPEQYSAGERWYEDAYEVALLMSEGSPYSLEQCVGVIAALSPINPWEQNVKLARRMVDSRGSLDEGYLKAGLRKARAILDGADPWEVLTSQKVRAFFECILYKGQTDIVCVDRHALSIWRGYEVTDTRMGAPLFRMIAADYQEAARELGMPAAVLQSVVWVVWRER